MEDIFLPLSLKGEIQLQRKNGFAVNSDAEEYQDEL